MGEWAYNPLTGNLDRVGDGSSPPPSIITINGDSGPPLVGDEFNIVGQEAGTVPVMEVDTSSGDVAIINNTWATQYVVDPSTTIGLKGTFQTIQDAVDQIVADGGSVSPFHTILIRPGTYPDDVVFPSGVGINLLGTTPVDEITVSLGALISGNLSGSGAYLTLENVFIQGAIDGSGIALLGAKNTNITTIGTNGSSGQFSFSNCAVNAGSFSGSQATFRNCILGGSSFVLAGGLINVRDCQITNCGLSGAPTAFIFNSTWAQAGNIIGDGTFNGFIYVGNCVAPASSALFNNIGGGTVSYSNITFPVSASVNRIMAASATPQTLNEVPSFGGNVKPLYKTAANFSLTRNNFYVGVTDTSSPRTITLAPNSPAGSAPYFGQVFEIKDESGNAAVNNITIAGTIDGQTNAVIRENYGFVRLMFDGTSYWKISDSVVSGPENANSILSTNANGTASYGTSLNNNYTFTSSTAGQARFVSVENTDNTSGSTIAYLEAVVGGLLAGSPFFRCRAGNSRSWAMGMSTADAGNPWIFKTDANGTVTPQSGGGVLLELRDTTGNVITPNNACASTDIQTIQSNVTGDGTLVNPVILEFEFFDQNGNYDPTTGLFTTKLGGKYLVTVQLTLGNLATSHNSGIVYIVAAGSVYGVPFNPGACRDSNNQYCCSITRIVQVGANQTIYAMVVVSGGTKTVSIQPNNFCSFSGTSIELIS